MVFLNLSRRRHHGGQSIGNLVYGFRKELFGKHGPGWAAGSQKEGKLSGCHFLCIVLRLGHRTHVGADGGLVHVKKSQLFQRFL